MPFFTRPDLDDREFKQLTGSTLTMSGTTNFVGTLKAKGIELDISTGGTSVGYVLTLQNSKIVLKPPTGGGSGETRYTGATPATISVGGLNVGTVLTGRSISSILQQMLVVYQPPTFTTFSIAITGQYEVGNPSVFSGTKTFTWTTSNSPNVSGNSISVLDVTSGITIGSGLPNSGTASLSIHTVTNITPITHSWKVTGINSTGGTFISSLSTMNSIYPYFYGKVASGGAPPGVYRPTANQTLINSGTAVVASSTGTITITFSSTSDDYFWFAIPSTSTSKTIWYVNALNSGSIGGGVSPGGNLFPTYDTVSINSPSGYWSGVSYKIYITNYQSAVASAMELRNS